MLIDQSMLSSLLEKAAASGRLRASHDLRTSASDGSQRMLNALLPGTHVPVHRHRGTTETVVIISGRITEVFFDDNGVECSRHVLDSSDGRYALQIPQGQWHTVIVDEPCVIFEAKDGAYTPLTGEDVWNYE